MEESAMVNVPEVRVGDVMTRRVATARPDESLHEVWFQLGDEHCHHLPVVEAGRVVGMISSRDLVRVADRLGVSKLSATEVGDCTVAEVMTEGLETIEADEPISAAIDRIGKGDLHALVVLDEKGDLAGIVTDRDLLQFMLN